MRIWSLHPSLLDTKGLVALWREGLLAKHVLEGKTKGYTNHPQLERFKSTHNPVETINSYLYAVLQEAKHRGYNFDESKVCYFPVEKLSVTKGQVDYEFNHLLAKLEVRDRSRYLEICRSAPTLHPLFYVVEGNIESFERV